MIRFGLCCIFKNEPIQFRRITVAHIKKIPREKQLALLSTLCVHNAHALHQSLIYCAAHKIGCFRVNSQFLPLKTHPEVGYRIRDLPEHRLIIDTLQTCREFCKQHDLRITFHPDQFILLSSPSSDIIKHSVADLLYHAEVATMIGADVITIHGGGTYGDKKAALKRLVREIKRLPVAVRSLLTLENDDRSYTPSDLLSVCNDTGIPFVYDVHHHRCLPDGLTVEAATDAACATWNREPVFHLSSPLHGWRSADPRLHHDYINFKDFPMCWKELPVTIEVEAKAKELAVLRLIKEFK